MSESLLRIRSELLWGKTSLSNIGLLLPNDMERAEEQQSLFKKITDVLGMQLSRGIVQSRALIFAYRSLCLAGGEIKNEAQGHAPGCHWSSGI